MATSGKSSAGPRPRILRIGVLLSGKIVEERLIRDRGDVTVGQSAKNTFSIPLETLPREWTLFKSHEGRYGLSFTSAMDGRLSDGDRVQTLEAARSGGSAVRSGDHFVLPLSEQARGKVSIGELTLLFQFITEPPVQPKPMLPHSVRGTLADRIEPRLAVIVAASIAVHFGFMIWALAIDPPGDKGIAYRAAQQTFQEDSYQVDDFVVPLPPDPSAGKSDDAPKGEDVKKPDKAPEVKPAGGDKKPAGDPKPAEAGRDPNDAVALQEESQRYADALFSEDDSGIGLAGAMENKKPGSDLGNQLDEVAKSGATTAVGGGTPGRGTRGDGDPRAGTGTGPGVTGPGGPVSASGPDGKGGEKVPTGRISATDKKAFDDSSLTPDAVQRKIMSAYLAGLKRCHKELLKTDPTARGKVKLAFTVNESGRTVSPKASGFADTLDNCIEGQMGNWRFDIPKDSDGEATDASFEISLQLVPE